MAGWLLQIAGFIVSFYVNQVRKRSAMPHAILGMIIFAIGACMRSCGVCLCVSVCMCVCPRVSHCRGVCTVIVCLLWFEFCRNTAAD